MTSDEALRDILLHKENKEKDRAYAATLENSKLKVKYLRIAKGYTQEETANMIELSIRQVQRIEKKIRGK